MAVVLATLVAWAEAGAPEGPPVSAMKITKQTTQWKLGKPDRVVQVPGAACHGGIVF